MTNSNKQLSSRTFLRMKIASLAAEAAIIKRQENKWWGEHPTRIGLHEHRVNVVRKESRLSQLALAFLRDMPYARVEESTFEPPDFDKVRAIALRFRGDIDERDLKQRFAAWYDDAIRDGIFNTGLGPYERPPSWSPPPPKPVYDGPKAVVATPPRRRRLRGEPKKALDTSAAKS